MTASPQTAQRQADEPATDRAHPLTGAVWTLSSDTNHDGLVVEPVPLDSDDWDALSQMPSKPAHPVLASITPADVDEHDTQTNPSPALCARLEEATVAYLRLHAKAHPGNPDLPEGWAGSSTLAPRYVLQDGGVLVGDDGRAWPVADVTVPTGEADPILDGLDEHHPDAYILDDWDEPGRGLLPAGLDVTIAQVALPFAPQAMTRLDGLLRSIVEGTPPRGRPTGYSVQPAPSGARVLAFVPALFGELSLRAVLTCKDEDVAFRLASTLTAHASDPHAARPFLDPTLDYAEEHLTAAAYRALSIELDRLHRGQP